MCPLEKRTSTQGIQIGTDSGGSHELPDISPLKPQQILLIFKGFSASQHAIANHFIFLRGIDGQTERSFQIGLVKAGHEGMGVVALELGIQVVGVVFRISIEMEPGALAVV